jgi:hypothetical protein
MTREKGRQVSRYVLFVSHKFYNLFSITNRDKSRKSLGQISVHCRFIFNHRFSLDICPTYRTYYIYERNISICHMYT